MEGLTITEALDALLQIHDRLGQAIENEVDSITYSQSSPKREINRACEKRVKCLLGREQQIKDYIVSLCQKPDQAPTKTGLGKLPPPPEFTGKVRYATDGSWTHSKFVAFCEGYNKVYFYTDDHGYTPSASYFYYDCLKHVASGVWDELDPETGEVKQ